MEAVTLTWRHAHRLEQRIDSVCFSAVNDPTKLAGRGAVFSLGGGSETAVRVWSQLQRRHGVKPSQT
eukprot:1180082-Prorocentrum_minimum.AAC.1